jgi:hypothetical protein
MGLGWVVRRKEVQERQRISVGFVNPVHTISQPSFADAMAEK